MLKYKKLFAFVSVIIILSILFTINTYAFTVLPSDSWVLRGSLDYSPTGEIPSLGTVTVRRGTASKSVSFYPNDDGVTLLEDVYGVYGFRWYFEYYNLSISNDDDYTGEYELNVFVPWTDSNGHTYFGYHTNNEYYRISELDLMFGCYIKYLKNGSYVTYRTQNQTATLYEGDVFDENSVIGSNTYMDDDIDNYGSYRIKSQNVLGLSEPQNLNLSIKWIGKPSSNNHPYIEFRFQRSSFMRGSYLREYLNELNNSARDEFEKLKEQLRVPMAEIDGSLSADDIDVLNQFMDEKSDFYKFSILLVTYSLLIGSFVYVLHGKKR